MFVFVFINISYFSLLLSTLCSQVSRFSLNVIVPFSDWCDADWNARDTCLVANILFEKLILLSLQFVFGIWIIQKLWIFFINFLLIYVWFIFPLVWQNVHTRGHMFDQCSKYLSDCRPEANNKWPGLITFPAFVTYFNHWADKSFHWANNFSRPISNTVCDAQTGQAVELRFLMRQYRGTSLTAFITCTHLLINTLSGVALNRDSIFHLSENNPKIH